MSYDEIRSRLTSTDMETWNHPLLAMVVLCGSVAAWTVFANRVPVEPDLPAWLGIGLSLGGMVVAVLVGGSLYALVDANDAKVAERLRTTDMGAWNHPMPALVLLAAAVGAGNYAANQLAPGSVILPALAGVLAVLVVGSLAAALD
jgi:hypothetical protein